MDDVGVLVGVPLLLGLAWLVPENYWPPIGQLLSPLAISGLTPDPETTLGSIRRTLGSRLPATDARKILRSMASEGILTFFQILKSYRLDRWAPAVRIANFERAPREAAVADTVRRYAAVLEPYVLRYPGQWLGWPQL